MLKKIRDVQPPRGLARLLWRAPIWLYHAGLGSLLGGRFLLLTHTGRNSNLPRKNVLEVIRHDIKNNVFYVASGFGEKSDWFQNITAQPLVNIQSGGKRFTCRARRLDKEDAAQEMLEYQRRHPSALKTLANVMGYEMDGSEEDARALGRLIPIVSFAPVETERE